jgi:hypothetical protein
LRGMRRSLWFRVCSFVCGLWLILGLTEPMALHACPMHNAHGGGHDHVAATASGHHAEHAHTSHSPDRATTCTCPGECCAAVVAAVPVVARITTSVAVRRQAAVFSTTASGFRPAAIEYARPPTIGPPRSTV